jgi:hypothetical protein
MSLEFLRGANIMSAGLQGELQSFQEFLARQLADGRDDMSPEEAVDRWRDMHSSPGQREDTIAAVREALADMIAGDLGRPIEEIDREVRERYFSSSRS